MILSGNFVINLSKIVILQFFSPGFPVDTSHRQYGYICLLIKSWF